MSDKLKTLGVWMFYLTIAIAVYSFLNGSDWGILVWLTCPTSIGLGFLARIIKSVEDKRWAIRNKQLNEQIKAEQKLQQEERERQIDEILNGWVAQEPKVK